MLEQLANIAQPIPTDFYIFVHFQTPETAESIRVNNGFISPSCDMWTTPEKLEKYQKNIIDNLPLIENVASDLVRQSPFLFSKIKAYIIEVEIERYRLAHYPNCPSRLTSIFAFNDSESINNAARLHNWQLQSVHKFKLIFSEHSRIAKVNMSIISYVTTNYSLMPENIRNMYWEVYWSGSHSILQTQLGVSPMPNIVVWEYLIEGRVEIVV